MTLPKVIFKSCWTAANGKII